MVSLYQFGSGFIFLVILKDLLMSYKFMAGVITGYVISHRDEFKTYRDVIEPYTDPYLDQAFDKGKELKETFEQAHSMTVKEKEKEKEDSWVEKTFKDIKKYTGREN